MSDTKQDRAYYRQLYIKVDPGQIYAFIPGTILEIFVKKGQKVKKGEALCSLHAMKMDNDVCSTIDGKVASVNIKKGQIISKNDVLFEIIQDNKAEDKSSLTKESDKKDNKAKSKDEDKESKK